MLNIVMHDIIENNFIEIWAQKDCNLCITLWASQEANVPKHPFSAIFSLEKVLIVIVLGMMNIYEEYNQK